MALILHTRLYLRYFPFGKRFVSQIRTMIAALHWFYGFGQAVNVNSVT